MGISDFLEGATPKSWGSEVEIERRRRIKVALWAWSYENYADTLVDDATFDAECSKINPAIKTGHKVMDDFFATEFAAFTGQWIHKHPELDKLDLLYHRIKKGQPKLP